MLQLSTCRAINKILQLWIANAISEVDRQEIIDKSINILSNCRQLCPAVVGSVAVASRPIVFIDIQEWILDKLGFVVLGKARFFFIEVNYSKLDDCCKG